MIKSIIFFFLLLAQISYGNETWECRRSKKGITIISTASYEDTLKTQKVLDAFLETIADELTLNEFPYKILILTDPYGINLAKIDTTGLATIAYDTLRPVDLDILMNKLSYENFINRDSPNSRVYLPDTLDYGITRETNFNELGLKIIFKHSRRDTAFQFDRIYTLVKYGVENIEKVKNTQRKIYQLSYGMNKVSITPP